jgi:hypothetical protein
MRKSRAAAAADDAEAMGIVAHEPRIEARGKQGEGAQGREIALHAEDTFGDQQAVTMMLPLCVEYSLCVVNIVVFEGNDMRAAQARACE